MPVSKRILLPLAAVAVIGAAGAYGVSQASANSTEDGPQASLVQKLADTFHIDKSKVQAVFNEERATHQKEREANYEERLSQAVTDGKLTSAQKDAVLAEHNQLAEKLKTLKTEMEADRDAAGSQTDAERRATMEKHSTAMKAIYDETKAWASQHDIDAKWLMGPGGHGGPGNFGGHNGFGHGLGQDEVMSEDSSTQ